MSKTWFGHIVGDTLHGGKFRRMCDLMHMTELEKRLAIARFSERKKVIQCDDIATEAQQKAMIPLISEKIESFVVDQPDFFAGSEMDKITTKYKAAKDD